MTPVHDRRALWIAVAAFVIWGLMPLYWHLLRHVPSLQIVLHRAVWCAVLVAAWLTLREGHGWLRAVIVQPRLAGMLALSGTLIAFNWGLYVWAVNSGHVVEASLGYFINPLMNVVLGVMLLGERLNPRQWSAIALAACGVLWLTFQFGSLPWIALCLATSFAFYGFIRKQAAVDSIPGLGIESVFLLLPALALLGWLAISGSGGHFADGDIGNLANVTGIGVVASSDDQELVHQFIAFLLSDEAQTFFTEDNFEYPITTTVEPAEGLATGDEVEAASPAVDLAAIDDLEGTLRLLREVGLL